MTGARVGTRDPLRLCLSRPLLPSPSQAALLLQLPHLPADAHPSGEGIHGDTVPRLGWEGVLGMGGGWAGERVWGVVACSSLTAPPLPSPLMACRQGPHQPLGLCEVICLHDPVHPYPRGAAHL